MRPQGLGWQLMGLGSRVRKAESAFRVQSLYPTVPPKSPREGRPFSSGLRQLGRQNDTFCSAAAA